MAWFCGAVLRQPLLQVSISGNLSSLSKTLRQTFYYAKLICTAACSGWNSLLYELNFAPYFKWQNVLALVSIAASDGWHKSSKKYLASEPIHRCYTWPEEMFHCLIIPQAEHVWKHLLVIYSVSHLSRCFLDGILHDILCWIYWRYFCFISLQLQQYCLNTAA